MLSGQRRREGFKRKPGNILASLFCCLLGARLVLRTGSSLPLPARLVVGLEGDALFLMQVGWIFCFFPQKILKFLALGYWEWGDIKSDFGFSMAAAEVSFFVAQTAVPSRMCT